MNPERPFVYGYGDDFDSIEKIEKAIECRKEQGLELNGAAILWLEEKGEEYPKRIGVRILPDGVISFAHAEDL